MNEYAASAAADDPWLTSFCDALRQRFGDTTEAILLYGSYLRGKRDTVLDFYVLVSDFTRLNNPLTRLGNRLLAPNVYNLVVAHDNQSRMAKYAVVGTRQFLNAIADDFHPYFWARFSQPCVVLFAGSPAISRQLRGIELVAGRRMLAATLPVMPPQFTTAELWAQAFALTYRCELRSEKEDKRRELVTTYAEHLSEITVALADTLAMSPIDSETWQHQVSRFGRYRGRVLWSLRTVIGKFLTVLRLFKAAFTFNEPLDYILWKVERHSGVHVEASARQRRHPLLYAWPVLWRLYRRGGFK